MAQGFEERRPVRGSFGTPAQGPNSPVSPVMAPQSSSFKALRTGVSEQVDRLMENVGGLIEIRTKKNMKTDYMRGQVAAQQGKVLSDEPWLTRSAAYASGFRSMKAATIADEMYTQRLAELESSDKAMTPAEYREKLAVGYSSLFTGDDELDGFLAELSLDSTRRLTSAHARLHSDYTRNENMQTGTSLLVSKAALAKDNPDEMPTVQDLLNMDSPDNPMHALLPQDRTKVISDALVSSLESGNKALLIAALSRQHGTTERGNIRLDTRTPLKNADGSISTVRSMSVNIDGQEVLLPTVGPKGEDWANDEAIANYKRTGAHLGKFSSAEDATNAARLLHNAQTALYTHGSPITTLIEDYGLSAGQAEAVGRAYDKARSEEQNAWNRDLFNKKHDLLRRTEAGEITLAQAIEEADKLRVEFDLDDNFMQKTAGNLSVSAARAERDAVLEQKAAAREARIDEKLKKQEAKEYETRYVPEAMSELRDIRIQIQDGKIDYAKGEEMGREVLKKYGLSERHFMPGQEREFDAADVSYHTQLKKAAAKADEAAAKEEAARRALSTGTLFLLDKEGKALAFSIAQRGVAESLAEMQKSGATDAEVVSEGARQYAGILSKYGVVDDVTKDRWTAGLLSMTSAGRMTAAASDALVEFNALYSVNPELALQHLSNDRARGMALAASNAMQHGEDINTALAVATGVVNNPTPVTKSDPSLDSAVKQTKAELDKQLPVMFTLFGMRGARRGTAADYTDAEMKTALEDPRLRGLLHEEVEAQLQRAPGLSSDMAIRMAVENVRGKVQYAAGNLLFDKTGKIDEGLGLDKFKGETGAVNDAVSSFLKNYGKQLFGDDWHDTEIVRRSNGNIFGDGGLLDVTEGYVATQKRAALNRMPILRIDYDGVAKSLIVRPVLNDNTLGRALIIPGYKVGAWYEGYRMRKLK